MLFLFLKTSSCNFGLICEYKPRFETHSFAQVPIKSKLKKINDQMKSWESVYINNQVGREKYIDGIVPNNTKKSAMATESFLASDYAQE